MRTRIHFTPLATHRHGGTTKQFVARTVGAVNPDLTGLPTVPDALERGEFILDGDPWLLLVLVAPLHAHPQLSI